MNKDTSGSGASTTYMRLDDFLKPAPDSETQKVDSTQFVFHVSSFIQSLCEVKKGNLCVAKCGERVLRWKSVSSKKLIKIRTICQTIFREPCQAVSHFLTHHKLDKPNCYFVCRNCNAILPTGGERVAHETMKLHCAYCSATFSSRGELLAHWEKRKK